MVRELILVNSVNRKNFAQIGHMTKKAINTHDCK